MQPALHPQLLWGKQVAGEEGGGGACAWEQASNQATANKQLPKNRLRFAAPEQDPELWRRFQRACSERLGVPPYPPAVVHTLEACFPHFRCSEVGASPPPNHPQPPKPLS